MHTTNIMCFCVTINNIFFHAMDMSWMREKPLVVKEKGNENIPCVCQVSECKEVYLFIEEYGRCGHINSAHRAVML